MKNKKVNRSEVFSIANSLYTKGYTRKEALTLAWAVAKGELKREVISIGLLDFAKKELETVQSVSIFNLFLFAFVLSFVVGVVTTNIIPTICTLFLSVYVVLVDMDNNFLKRGI